MARNSNRNSAGVQKMMYGESDQLSIKSRNTSERNSGDGGNRRSKRCLLKATSRKVIRYLETGAAVVTFPLWAPYALWKVYKAAFDG